ncbi:MAG: single-stranded-DNA-specific exonuclease RecJ [Deltaproteobacteria bacterium]|nr:single-stranded-DNA-specific exonuclease RecJ [Deltaproteobacteria bacterium]
MKEHWQIHQPDPDVVDKMSRDLGYHPITAAVLVNREISTLSDAQDFLNTSLNNLRPPFSLRDMEAAVNRIHKAIISNEKILIFGDYDVDGVTSVVILLNFLRYAGADVSYYIPHRIAEGYSIQPGHITQYVRPNQFDLIITADCGAGSHQAVEAANRFNIDVIVTDHHNISEDIPPALAVINPKRHDCHAGLQNLAGVGVAFFLLICLRTRLREMGFWDKRPEPNLKEYCDLVALGTVADMVPLIEENRILSKTGLELINTGHRPGLTALLEASAIRNQTLSAEDIAFRLAPRLNAAGRMDHAARAVDLLIAEDIDAANKTAHTLNLLNRKRQDLEKGILADIERFIDKNSSLLRLRSLVLYQQGWHAGVLGIVASRMMRTYHRPVVLISLQDGTGKGSARSVEGLNIYDALTACGPFLEGFGGHAMAAGLQIREENIADFQNAFESEIQRTSSPETLVPAIQIDSELDVGAISDDLLDELELLMPFGVGNPEPLFLARDVKVISSKIVGQNHRRMVLSQTSGYATATIAAIHFNVNDDDAKKFHFDQMVFRLHWNRWNGKKTAQIVVEDLQ